MAADAHADLVACHGELLAAEGVAAGGEQGERARGEHADDKRRVATGFCGQGEEADLGLGGTDAFDGVDGAELCIVGVSACWRGS